MGLESDDIHQVLSNHLKSDDFEYVSFESLSLDEVSIGFLSSVDKARITYRTRGEEQELHVFIKKVPNLLYHRINVIAMGSFHREVVLYNEVLNKFHDQLNDNTIPKCYLARSNDILVMENLSKKGFKNLDLFEPFDLEHCKKTIEALAKFHSLSFLTEKKEKRKMVEILPIIETELVVSKDLKNPARKATLTSFRALRRVFDVYLPQYSADVKKKAFNYLDNLFDELKSSKNYANVMVHSDLWCNNLMFRYNDTGSVQEACLLDFQLSTYRPPSYDIQFFLNTCTDNTFREKHCNQLMKHYYNTLSETLSSSGMDLAEVMTWSDFENMLDETHLPMIAQATLCLLYVMMPNDVLTEVMGCDQKFKVYYEEDRTEYTLEAMKRPDYRRRVLETFTNFVDNFNN